MKIIRISSVLAEIATERRPDTSYRYANLRDSYSDAELFREAVL
jgi:hypothetical protein